MGSGVQIKLYDKGGSYPRQKTHTRRPKDTWGRARGTKSQSNFIYISTCSCTIGDGRSIRKNKTSAVVALSVVAIVVVVDIVAVVAVVFINIQNPGLISLRYT